MTVDDRWLSEVAAPIVRQVARRLAKGAWVADYDDLVQEGLVAVWREKVTDRRLVWTVAQRRMIDAQRRVYGRAGTLGYAAHNHMKSIDVKPHPMSTETIADSLGAGDPALADAETAASLPSLLDVPAKYGGLSDKERELLIRRADGETLASIGRSWGVTESRACQVSQSARRKLDGLLRGAER